MSSGGPKQVPALCLYLGCRDQGTKSQLGFVSSAVSFCLLLKVAQVQFLPECVLKLLCSVSLHVLFLATEKINRTLSLQSC
jgi:hypothetical protein